MVSWVFFQAVLETNLALLYLFFSLYSKFKMYTPQSWNDFQCFYWKHMWARHSQLWYDFSETYPKHWDSWKAFRLFWRETYSSSLRHTSAAGFCTCVQVWKAKFIECSNSCPANFSLLGISDQLTRMGFLHVTNSMMALTCLGIPPVAARVTF